MISRKRFFGDEFGRMNMVHLFKDFFKEEPFWSNTPLFPPLEPTKELALINYMEPLADIIESEKNIKAKLEIPGMEKGDIKINIVKNGIEIKADRKEESSEEDKKKGRYRLERNYSGFYRYFSLPDNADTEKIEAEYKNGILDIEIPKKAKIEDKAKEVKVK